MGHDKTADQQVGMGPTSGRWGHDDFDYSPYNCRSCRENGTLGLSGGCDNCLARGGGRSAVFPRRGAALLGGAHAPLPIVQRGACLVSARIFSPAAFHRCQDVSSIMRDFHGVMPPRSQGFPQRFCIPCPRLEKRLAARLKECASNVHATVALEQRHSAVRIVAGHRWKGSPGRGFRGPLMASDFLADRMAARLRFRAAHINL